MSYWIKPGAVEALCHKCVYFFGTLLKGGKCTNPNRTYEVLLSERNSGACGKNGDNFKEQKD